MQTDPQQAQCEAPQAEHRNRSGALEVAAPILEAFASIQGEGLFVGRPQVFLRLSGCPLRCRWCDTPRSLVIPDQIKTRIEVPVDPDDPEATPAGRRIEEGSASPLRAAAWVAELDPSGRRAVSVTGGEPLLHPGFLLGLAALLGERRLHLETAGAHPRTLQLVLGEIDHVSLDLKPAEDLDAPVDAPNALEASPRDARDWEDARSSCLRLVRDRDACAKIVISSGDPARYLNLLDDVADLAPDLPVLLQPVTPRAGFATPERAAIEFLVEAGLERALDVRVVPQVHRMLRLP